ERFSQLEEQLATIDSKSPVETILSQMTARQKVLQLISFPVVLSDSEASVSAEVAWVQQNQPGFVTLFGSGLTASEVASFSAEVINPTGSYSPLIAVDHEGGTVQRLRGSGFTILPSWRQECATPSADRLALFAKSASELAAAGVQIVFAPVLDVAQAGSFLGTRACQDGEQAVAAATDYITSFGQYGILPVIKHFPGIGSITNDLHFEQDVVDLTPEDTAPFNTILSAFPNVGVMTTHVAVENRTNGVPCSLSATCLEVFPTNFPNALLFTDALEMASAAGQTGQAEPQSLPVVAVQAVTAGNDVLVFGERVNATTIETVINAVTAKYTNDKTFAEKVDASARKILMLKLPAPEETTDAAQ
ncbi:MAG: glycoside hydrolase family 3 N-terminal domain-containing protein, partial [Sedimentisphaerales bacterium]|nr:glycoside hydrolase family 3 N-terminal domain-containing protein [Sedimentisphaerales bacterium]